MNFKALVLSIVFIIVGFAAQSQTSDAEAEAIINLLGVQKKQAIEKLVPVTGKDSVAFWKLYNEYEKENKVFAVNRSR